MALVDPIELSPPPRPILPRVRKRAWAEPVVRFWWVLSAVLVLLAPFVGAPPFRQWQKLSKLASQPPVQAKILKTDRDTVAGRPVLPGAPVHIRIAGAASRELWGTLDGWANGPLPAIGDTIEIRVDPDDANAWSVVHKVPPMATALSTGLAVAGVAVVPLLVSIMLRRRVLNVWRIGEVREAAVVGQQQTALAPGAYALRCAWIDEPTDGVASEARVTADDRRADRAIFNVFVPKRLQPATDDQGTIQVLAIPGGKCVALDWFNA